VEALDPHLPREEAHYAPIGMALIASRAPSASRGRLPLDVLLSEPGPPARPDRTLQSAPLVPVTRHDLRSRTSNQEHEMYGRNGGGRLALSPVALFSDCGRFGIGPDDHRVGHFDDLADR